VSAELFLMKDRMPDADAVLVCVYSDGSTAITTGDVLHRYRAQYGHSAVPYRYADANEIAEHTAECERLARYGARV
jgi:hypothetical protein